MYDPGDGTWTATDSLNNARQDHIATLLPNGTVLVAGGYNDVLLSSAEVYDPATGQWTPTGSLNAGRQEYTATLLANGKVLVAGGRKSGGELASAEVYEYAEGSWTPTSSLNAGRDYHTATLLSNGMVLVAGGYSNGVSLSSAELYSRGWMPTGSLNTPRYNHTATLLPNGKVLVAGGESNGVSLASAELYDPASGTWTPTGPLNTARGYHTATLLPNGKVLVAGGWVGGYLASAELYDPASGTWTPTGPLNTTRGFHTATLLPNGKVLVAGGYGDSGYLAGAELYDVGLSAWPYAVPVIESVTSPLRMGSSLVVTGYQFRGLAEGSGGNTQDSPADYPVVQLRRLDNEQTRFVLPTSWSSNTFASVPVTGLGVGYALVTVFVNGIPSEARILGILGPALPFQITSIVRTNANDLLITWNTSGTSNIVQITPGTGTSGSFSTNDFTDVVGFGVTTDTTNFWDVGALTNKPARYYRVRSPE